MDHSAISREEVKKLVDDALKVHVYEQHKRRGPHFTPPTREDLEAYAKSIGLALAVEVFFDFYESKGWKVGSAGMKDWKAAARRAVREGWARLMLAPKTIAEQRPKEVVEVATLEQRRAIALHYEKLAEKLKATGIGYSQRVFEARRQVNLNKLDLVNKMKTSVAVGGAPAVKPTGGPLKADFEGDPALQMDESERAERGPWEQG
ncbi:MAG: hypothetical protein V2A79_10165 [Planctomycetota bacterium]